jgi:hypothetical protein
MMCWRCIGCGLGDAGVYASCLGCMKDCVLTLDANFRVDDNGSKLEGKRQGESQRATEAEKRIPEDRKAEAQRREAQEEIQRVS